MKDILVDSYTNVTALGGSDNFQPRVVVRSMGREVQFVGSLDDLELMAHEILRNVDQVRHPRPAGGHVHNPSDSVTNGSVGD